MGWQITLTNIEKKHKSEYSFDKPVVRVGREPNNEIVVTHPRISRLHFSLSRQGDHCFLTDSSRNGVLIKIDDGWSRVHQEIGLIPPVQLLLPNWAFEAEFVQGSASEDDDDQVWDQSVVIPAGRLAHKQEAILVFDLCASSVMASRDDHMAYHLKRRLTQIAEPVLNEHGQTFFKSTGDGFLATFGSCAKALAATTEIEDRIHHRNRRTNNPPIHYRLALHFGETWAISTGGADIHGHDVNVTFRIEGVQQDAFADLKAKFPAQDRILCSESFHTALDKECGGTSSQETVACGAAALKGIENPVEIYWVINQYSEISAGASNNSVNSMLAD